MRESRSVSHLGTFVIQRSSYNIVLCVSSPFCWKACCTAVTAFHSAYQVNILYPLNVAYDFGQCMFWALRSKIGNYDLNKQQMDTAPMHIIPSISWHIFSEESPVSDSSSFVLYWQYLSTFRVHASQKKSLLLAKLWRDGRTINYLLKGCMEVNFSSLSLSQENMHRVRRYACTDVSSVVTEENLRTKDWNWYCSNKMQK